MIIADIEAIPLFVPVPELPLPPFSVRHERETGKALFSGYRTTIVRLTTDTGLIGIGECGSRLAPAATKAIVEELRPILVGKDPTAFDYVWDLMFATMQTAGHSRGFFIEAISGIDIACWDIAGKSVGRSVASLMGGPYRGKLRAYASALPLSDDPRELGRRCETFLESGYTVVKAKIKSVMIVTKARDHTLVQLTRNLAKWLMTSPRHGKPYGVKVHVDAKLENCRCELCV